MRTVTIILGTALLLCSTIAHAQWWGNGKKVEGNGTMVTKTRTTSTYDQIRVKGNLHVSLIAGNEGAIQINGESNLIQHIITEVDGDALNIYVEDGYYLKQSTGKQLLITVPFTDISKVTLAGSGDVYSDATIKSSEFTTSVSGSGDIRLSINAEQVQIAVSGSGDVSLKGNSHQLTCKVTGSGDIKAYDLKASDVYASVTGSGGIKITATNSLKARITGSGDIDYKGNPEKEDKKVTGSGDITKM